MTHSPRSVREITDHIRGLFDSDALLGDLWIAGEVLESTVSRSGHVFFTLAGDGAQLRCVLFRMNALRQRTLPAAGSACVAHGRIEVYATEGTYQFYVDLVEEAGIGLAALELQLLRQQLEAEGLFSETRKRPLPRNPRIVGVITSQSGAVWHDIQNVVRRRFPFTQLLLAPAAVQGDRAAKTLIEALHSLTLDGRAEIIIIARGGGSSADLSVFNDENLVRAVFASPIPVVSAIGHETDWTLLDLVADIRAPTPSAAAELVTPAIDSELTGLMQSLARQADRFERELSSQTMDVARLTALLERKGPAFVLSEEHARLLHLRSVLVDSTTKWLFDQSARLDGVRAHLSTTVRSASVDWETRGKRLSDLLQALSPVRTLSRGYAFVEHGETSRPLKSVTDVIPGERLHTRLFDGSIETVVSSVSPTN